MRVQMCITIIPESPLQILFICWSGLRCSCNRYGFRKDAEHRDGDGAVTTPTFHFIHFSKALTAAAENYGIGIHTLQFWFK